MGAVFRAWDLRLERAVAIKVVRADLLSDPDSRARFRRESQIVARLQHPAIVTVFDYGTLPDGAAFLVMEFVPGEDLRHLMKREGRADAGAHGGAAAAALPAASSRRTSRASSIAISSRKTSCCRKAAPDRRWWTSAWRSSPTQSTTGDGGTLTSRRHHRRDAGLHGAGAVARRRRRRPRRRVQPRRDDVRDADGAPAVRRRVVHRHRDEAGGGETRSTPAALPPALADVIRRAIAYERDQRPASPVAFANAAAK